MVDHTKPMRPQKDMSRRSFVGASVAGGVLASVPFGGSIAGVGYPKKGGTLRIGFDQSAPSETMDPATLDGLTALLSVTVSNNLVELDQNMKLVPELAESWDSSAKADKWVIKLRRGVEFHNGKTVTAEDIIDTLNYHRGEDSKSAVKSLLDSVESITADDPYTVVIELSAGNADFLYLMADYHLPVFPADTRGIDFDKGIRTGGYKLESFEPGVRSSAIRNKNYWKSDRAHFDSIEILNIGDASARTIALRAGDIDVMNRCELKTVGLLEKDSNVQVINVRGTQHYCMPMQANAEPFTDNNVRLAMKHAIDRDAMVQTVLKGYGSVANDHPIAPANRYFANELVQRSYDPDKAKYHLSKAGLDKLSVSYHVADSAFVGAVDAAQLFREQARACGLDVTVVREPNDGYWSNIWKVKPFFASYWFGRPTEDWMFSTVYARGVPWNESSWDHDRFNKLLVEARSQLDEHLRKDKYVELQRIVRNEGSVIIPVYANYVSAARSNVRTGQIARNSELDGLKLAERWWFA